MCPVAPAPAGNGLGMRAALSVGGLARHHRLTVAVVAHETAVPAGALEWAAGRAGRVEMVTVDRASSHALAHSWLETARGRTVAASSLPDLVRWRPPALGQQVMDRVGCSFDAVMVMGAYCAGLALPFVEAEVPAVLDAFDDDAKVSAELAALEGRDDEEAIRFAQFQRHAFGWFDRVVFTSADDARPPFVHVPNAVRVPTAWATRPMSEPLELLFVGTRGYLPNDDAVARLAGAIVPAVERLGVEVRLHHPAPDDDVGSFYARAHIALAPLRAGGGTSIKVLEAFAHGCPVVASPTGARGLLARAGEHLVVTASDDDDDAFARAVVDLAADDERRRALAARARDFVAAHHDVDKVGDEVARLVSEVAAARQVQRGGRRVVSNRPSVIDGLDVNEVKDGLIVYEEKTDRVHYLNATASIVFTLCDGQHTPEDIADVMATAFGLGAAPTSEVNDCLTTLASEGLLR